MFDKCLNPISIKGNLYACGKCRYCRAKRQMTWTLRGKHEGLNSTGKIFITLTYRRENLPKNKNTKKENQYDDKGTLKKRDLQLFIKRLRKKYPNKKLKYIACGEYSPKRWRPHYHAIIFGISNKEIGKLQLEKLWKNGFVHIDEKPLVTPDAIAYTVGYINKKMQDNHNYEHYQGNGREEPFQLQSQKIGLKWLKNHDITSLHTGFDLKTVSIPRYYINKIYEEEGIKIRLDNTIITARDGNKSIIENLFEKPKIIGRTIYYTSHTTKYYKTFINPNGEKTKKILENLYKNKLENIEKTATKYKLSEQAKAKMRAKTAIENQEYIKKLNQEWQDAQNMTMEELKLKYEHTTVKFINRWTGNQWAEIIPTGFTSQEYISAIENARQKNEKIEINLKKYEKRKGIDTELDIDDFINRYAQPIH